MVSEHSRTEDFSTPARATAEELCGVLDDALLQISRSDCDPDARRALAELTSHALRAVYAAIGASHEAGEYRDAMVVAAMQIDEAIAAAEAVDGDETAGIAQSLRLANELASQNPLPSGAWRLPGSSARGLRLPASVGAPRLLDLTREVLSPVVPLAPTPVAPVLATRPSSSFAPIASLEELDALVADAEALPSAPDPKRGTAAPKAKRVRGVASATDALARSARILAEELGVLGGQRRPAAGKGWGAQARFEARLLARVDALVACGEHVLPTLVRGLESRPVPDPELTWGLVFLHGVIAGDDSLDEAMRLVRASELDDPGLRDAAVDALAHLPSSRVEGRLRGWLTHADAPVRGVAVAALGRRGGLLPQELAAAASDDDELVVRAAASAVGNAGAGVSPATLDALLHHADESVVRLALEGAAFGKHPAAVARARTLVRTHRGDFANASLIYALCAGRAALDDLLEDSAVGGSSASLGALGWFGHLDAVPYLCGRLDSEDDAIREGAAKALQRITGLAKPGAREPLLLRLPVVPPSIEAEAWRDWWTTVGGDLERTARYRHGAPWTASINVAELRAATSGLRVREFCLLELRARVGLHTPVDLRGFVATQLTSLSTLEEELRTTELPQAGWPVTMWV